MPSPASAPGADEVARGVRLFLDRMLSDEGLVRAFDGIDAERREKHARAIVIAALGGPDLYVGRDMQISHEDFHLSDSQFDAAVDHLVASLREVGLSESVIASMPARLEPLRYQIVDAPPPA